MTHYSAKLAFDVLVITRQLENLDAVDVKIKTGLITRGDGHYGFIVELYGVPHWISVDPVKSERQVDVPLKFSDFEKEVSND